MSYILVMQNTEYNQEKQKLSQISPFTKLLKWFSLIQFLGYWLWSINSLTHKYQIYSDGGRYRFLHSNYATLQEPCLVWNQCQRLPIQYRGVHRPLSLTRQGSFMYLNLFYTAVLVVLIPPQNVFKMFPHISGLENIAFVKSWYWDLSITIESISFNLDRW